MIGFFVFGVLVTSLLDYRGLRQSANVGEKRYWTHKKLMRLWLLHWKILDTESQARKIHMNYEQTCSSLSLTTLDWPYIGLVCVQSC